MHLLGRCKGVGTYKASLGYSLAAGLGLRRGGLGSLTRGPQAEERGVVGLQVLSLKTPESSPEECYWVRGDA